MHIYIRELGQTLRRQEKFMEDSFKVRVDKVFGNLGGNTTPSAAVDPSLWCLSDEEIEKREWNRNKEVAEDGEEEEEGLESGPSVVRSRLESDLEELSDDEEDEEEDGEEIDGKAKKRRRNGGGGAEASVDEYLDVRSNIGLDCTLDYEEEEDVYDKVAVGMEQKGDSLYMRNVKCNDYTVDEVNGYGELPNTFLDVVRDPRANHEAAKMRLREDAEAAGDIGTLQLSDNSTGMNSEAENQKKGELDSDNPKPILKKRETPESRSQKRVRFMVDPENNTHDDQQSSGANMASELYVADDSPGAEKASDLSQYSTGVPDYLRNPSKYTHYTFDSSDNMDEESNRKAYNYLFQFLRKTETSLEDASSEIPKSIVFTPKKKSKHDSAVKRGEGEHNVRENFENKSWSVGTTGEDDQETEITAMEEDETAAAGDGVHSSRKSGRQYRTRTNIDVDE